MKIGIVTDSTSDISEQEAAANQITVIPAVLVIDGKQYIDGKGLSREEYYNQLPEFSPPPTTASPSSGTFTSTYQKLFSNGVEKIFSIHVSEKLSGIVNAAEIAAQNFGDRVQVIDSGQLSLGLGFQVLGAAKAALNGSLEQIHETLNDIRRRLRVVAMMDTLEQLKRSGRVNWLRSSLGTLLRVKLFLEVKESEVLRLGETRTRSKGIQRLSDMIESAAPYEQLAIVHTNAYEEASTLAEKFSPLVSHPPLIRNVTTVIGTHVGVNAIGFISIQADKHQP
ncbi:MAG: DegV family protein [Anaerolineales bacterium]